MANWLLCPCTLTSVTPIAGKLHVAVVHTLIHLTLLAKDSFNTVSGQQRTDPVVYIFCMQLTQWEARGEVVEQLLNWISREINEGDGTDLCTAIPS